MAFGQIERRDAEVETASPGPDHLNHENRHTAAEREFDMGNRGAGLMPEEIEHHALTQFLVHQHGEIFTFCDGAGDGAGALRALFVNPVIE